MKELTELINKTKDLAQQSDGLGNIASFYNDQVKEYQQKVRTIVVIGEVKKGKSTLINTLIGKRVSPVSSDVATSTVIEFEYAKQEKIIVHHLPPKEDVPGFTTEINPDELETFVTEDGNPNNSLLVDRVSISHSSSFLAKGYRIVDSPGLGGLYRKHASITWKHIPRADIILFALDSVEALMTKDEVNYLKKIAVFKVPIVFVQTKIDMVEETQWKTWMQRNLSIISEALEIPAKNIPYYPVSAKLYNSGLRRKREKYIKSSLMPNLLSYLLVHLPKMEQRRITNNCRKMSLDILNARKQDLGQSIKVLTSPSNEALQEISMQLQKRKKDFFQWKSTTFVQLKEQCRTDMRTLQKSTQRKLQDTLNSSSTGTLISSYEEDIMRVIRLRKSEVNDGAAALVAQLEEQCIKESFLILDDMQHKFSALFGKFDQRVSSHIKHLSQVETVADTTDVQYKPPSIIRNLMMAKGVGLTIKMGVMSQLGGLAIATISAPVALGFLAGALILRSNLKDHRAKMEESMQRKITQKMSEAVVRQRTYVMRHFEDAVTSMNKEVERMQKAMMDYQQQKLEKETTELADAQKSTKESLNTQIIASKKEYAEVETLYKNWFMLGRPAKRK